MLIHAEHLHHTGVIDHADPLREGIDQVLVAPAHLPQRRYLIRIDGPRIFHGSHDESRHGIFPGLQQGSGGIGFDGADVVIGQSLRCARWILGMVGRNRGVASYAGKIYKQKLTRFMNFIRASHVRGFLGIRPLRMLHQTLAETGNMTRAAGRLCITPSTLSQIRPITRDGLPLTWWAIRLQQRRRPIYENAFVRRLEALKLREIAALPDCPTADGGYPETEGVMITVMVRFDLPRPIDRAKARETFLSTAPRYRGMPGLIRKYYFLSEDGARAGGVYLWQSRADADRLYTDDWKAFIRDKYGADPVLTYLETPVVVDNTTDAILSDEA